MVSRRASHVVPELGVGTGDDWFPGFVLTTIEVGGSGYNKT